MVAIMRSFCKAEEIGVMFCVGSAKFTGSGGAVVALFPAGEAGAAALQRTKALCIKEEFTIIQAHVATATE